MFCKHPTKFSITKNNRFLSVYNVHAANEFQPVAERGPAALQLQSSWPAAVRALSGVRMCTGMG
jgi:hypothetical protein